MQNSEMTPSELDVRGIQSYHTGFVLIVTLVFLFVLVMSSASQGVAKFEENFFQRNLLIESFNRLRIKLGDRVINDVLIGENGWMELGGRNLDDYQNAIPFSSAELKAVAGAVQACYKYAQDHHMTFLVVVAPNKASIYPDKLPEQIQPLSDTSRLDQLNNYLKEHEIPEVLDLRPALREARKQHDVYYKLGSHWNAYGAYIAYETIIHALSQNHRELIPYSSNFFRFRDRSPGIGSSAGDIARIIQANYLVFEHALFPTRAPDEILYRIRFPGSETIPGYHEVTWIPKSELPSLLIYHDSFGVVELNDYLALNFSQVFYIRRHARSGPLHLRTIEQFAPDIVIYEVVERSLHLLKRELSGCAEE